MRFIYDLQKSAENLVKHGIDFDAAQELWKDPHGMLNIPNSYNEFGQCLLAIGQAQSKLWGMIYAIHGNTIRIISVRKAHDHERQAYEILKS